MHFNLGTKIEVGQRHVYADEIFHLKNILKVSYEDIFPEYCDTNDTDL